MISDYVLKLIALQLERMNELKEMELILNHPHLEETIDNHKFEEKRNNLLIKIKEMENLNGRS